MARHIKFLALCRDGKVLATHLHWNKEAPESYEDTLKQIFSSPGWSALLSTSKTKLELKSGANVYCLELDSERRVFAAVLTSSYPIRHIFSASSSTSSSSGSGSRKLMAEFKSYVHENLNKESLAGPEGGLQRSLSKFLDRLAVSFDDLDSIDKVHLVQSKLDGLQKTVAKNLLLADERASLLDPLAEKTRALESGSRAMFSRSQSMRRRACCARYSLMAKVVCLIVIVLVLVIGVVLGLNYSTLHWWG